MSISASGGESMTSGYDPVLDDVIEEVANRLQAGEPVDAAAILARYPDRADSIRRLLPAMEVMAEFGVSASRLAAWGVPAGLGPIPAGRGTLGDFRILREIGRGGMGIVYEAEQVSLGRRVALKVLPFAGAMDSHQLRRFRTEAQAAAHLHHTNIVPVYWIGSEQGVHYYAMQLIEGRTLADVIRELRHLEGKDEFAGKDGEPDAATGPAASALASALTHELPPRVQEEATPLAGPCVGRGSSDPARSATEGLPVPAPPSGSSTRNRAYYRNVARLGLEAAEGLAHAHQEGIVHRDIKPANLMVDVKGNLWITDFGLARLQGENGLTITGDLLGTVRYMSPEQATGRRGYLDHRTDIYSLGATLYELLTLEPAFGSRDRQALLRQIAVEEPRSPRRLDESIPRELETIVLKAMAKEPSGRYQNAEDLADDLRRFLEYKPIRAKPPTGFEQVSKWIRRHPSIVIAAIATLMTTALVFAAAFVLIAREQVATRSALKQARDERENAKRSADIARGHAERADHRYAVVRQTLDALLLRLNDQTLPDVPEVRELRHAVAQHALRTIEGFVDASSRDPQVLVESVVAYEHLANFYFVGGQIDEYRTITSLAIGLAEQLAAEYPSEASYRTLLGDNHFIAGLKAFATGRRAEATDHFNRARRTYSRAVEMDPVSIESLRRQRWFLAICPEARFRDPDRVLALTAEMIEREAKRAGPEAWDPTRSPHWLLRGIAHYRKGSFGAAIDSLERPLQTEHLGEGPLYGAGDLGLGWFILAMAHHQAGRRARALDCYRIAVRVMDTTRPRDVELMNMRAEAAALLGATDDPKSTIKTVKDAARPTNP